MRFLDVTLRFQRGRTSVPACMTNPREHTPHILHSEHTESTGSRTQTGTHNCRMNIAQYAQWTQRVQAAEHKQEHITVECTLHNIHSGHTVSIGRKTQTGTHNCRIYIAQYTEWTYSEYRQQNRNWNT
jgi:hypothetical protein